MFFAVNILPSLWATSEQAAAETPNFPRNALGAFFSVSSLNLQLLIFGHHSSDFNNKALCLERASMCSSEDSLRHRDPVLFLCEESFCLAPFPITCVICFSKLFPPGRHATSPVCLNVAAMCKLCLSEISPFFCQNPPDILNTNF